VLKETSYSLELGFKAGRVSMGFMHATPGDMKSFYREVSTKLRVVRPKYSVRAIPGRLQKVWPTYYSVSRACDA
jgi:hypothetical protein